MRRLLVAGGWMVKGVLLLVAAGVMVLWAMSGDKEITWAASRYRARPEWVDWFVIIGGCSDGHMFIWMESDRYREGPVVADARRDAAKEGGRWQWRMRPVVSNEVSVDFELLPRFGPVRWRSYVDDGAERRMYSRAGFVPCWVVAVVAGIWPAGSLGRVVGRGVRRRRREGAGRCGGCGYDLRATPERCPECGREVRRR